LTIQSKKGEGTMVTLKLPKAVSTGSGEDALSGAGISASREA
jgi:hypothetical protein